MPYKVICIDDNPDILRGLERMVPWDDLDLVLVGTASNGAEGLAMAERENPDILITDIRMPAMNGLEMVRRVRNLHLDIAIIIVSGYDDFEYAREALQLGVVDYILKPVTVTKAIDALSNVAQLVRSKAPTEADLPAPDRVRDEAYDTLLARRLDQIVHDPNPAIFRRFNETVDFLKIGFRFENFHLFVIHAEVSRNLPHVYERVCATFSRLRNYQRGKYLTILSGRGLVWLLVAEGVETPDALLSRVSRMLSLEISENCAAGYGGLCRRLYDLPEVFFRGNIAFRQGFFDRFRILHGFVEQNLPCRDSMESFDAHVARMRLLFRNGRIAEGRRLFEEFFLSVRRTPAEHAVCMFDYLISMAASLGLGAVDEIEKTWSVEHLEHRLLIHLTRSATECSTGTGCVLSEERVRRFVDAHLSEDIRLSSIAEFFGISPNYFSALFKKQFSENYKDYVKKRKIARAKTLLKRTNLRIYEVAERVGYHDLKHFREVFRQCTRRSPAEFRHQGVSLSAGAADEIKARASAFTGPLGTE